MTEFVGKPVLLDQRGIQTFIEEFPNFNHIPEGQRVVSICPDTRDGVLTIATIPVDRFSYDPPIVHTFFLECPLRGDHPVLHIRSTIPVCMHHQRTIRNGHSPAVETPITPSEFAFAVKRAVDLAEQSLRPRSCEQE